MECAIGSSFLDLMMCGVFNAFGGDFTLFGVFLIIALIFMAYSFRIPAILALGMGWAFAYAIMIISGGSFVINMFFSLLTVGMGVSIILYLLKIGRQS